MSSSHLIQMERLALFCVTAVAITGFASGQLPNSVNASEGENVTFSTSQPAGQAPLTLISWTFNSLSIITSVSGTNVPNPLYKDRITLNVLDGSLELRNVAKNDSGEYAVNLQPTPVSPPTNEITNLEVYERVSNAKVSINSTDSVEFSSVFLSCSASGSPSSFLWFNGSAGLAAGDRVQITDGGASLTIVTVLRYDQGFYSCQASNPLSSDTSDEELLLVSYGPENVNMTDPPLDEYEEGSVIPMSCSADSRPQAQFEWLLDGEMLSISGANINLKLMNSGNYSCEAFNSKTLNKTQSRPVAISIVEAIKNVQVTPSTQSPKEGISVNLTCDAAGHNPSRKWMFNNVAINPSENNEFFDNNKVLSFKSLTRGDNGKYTCEVSNTFSSQSAVYIMTVNYGPENVKILCPNEKVKTGSPLKLSCSTDSLPTAKYTWMKDGKSVGESQEYTKEKTQKTDAGSYSCRATNDITSKSLEASCDVSVKGGGIKVWVIVLIVLSSIAAVLLVSGGGFYVYKKKKAKSSTRTDGEGQDNSAFTQNQEVNYADVRFVKRDGEVVQLGVQNNNTEYSEVKRDNNKPAASRLPSYDAHMQRRPAPEPPTEYAEVRRK